MSGCVETHICLLGTLPQISPPSIDSSGRHEARVSNLAAVMSARQNTERRARLFATAELDSTWANVGQTGLK